MAAFGPPPGQPAQPSKKAGNSVQTTRTTSIIDDDVNLLCWFAESYDLPEKVDELFTGMTRRSLAMYLAGFHVQCGIQRKCAVTIILEAVSFDSPGGQWKHWIQPVLRLNR